jgi:hypothetical protein
MLLAYVAKSLVLRYGGMDLYTRSIPAALGLIAGQTVMIVVWNIYHAVAAPPQIAICTGIFQ